MRTVYTIVLILLSVIDASFAQEVDGNVSLRKDKYLTQIRVAGQGNHVCSAYNSFGEVPVLGRGQSEREARILAKQECAKQSDGSDFFCKVQQCEQDFLGGTGASVVFDVVRDGGKISVQFASKTKFTCYATGWNNSYIAKAPTKTEALALAKGLCADDEGVRRGEKPNAFFCKQNANDCEMIEGVSGKVNVREVIDIFRKKK